MSEAKKVAVAKARSTRKKKPPYFDPETGKQLCGAMIRDKKNPDPNAPKVRCRKRPIAGKDRCKWHGGKNVRGEKHWNYKHGMYSQFLPQRLRETFDQTMTDESLRTMTAEVALANARLIELVQRLQTGETQTLWAELRRARAELHTARAANDAAGMANAMTRIDELILRGGDVEEVWQDINEAMSGKRELHDSEWKRLATLHQMMTTDRVMALIGALVAVVRRHVTDQDTLDAIGADIAALLEHRTVSNVA